jgi:hypothetical protein
MTPRGGAPTAIRPPHRTTGPEAGPSGMAPDPATPVFYCPDCRKPGIEVCTEKANEWGQTEYLTHCKACGRLRYTQSVWPEPPSEAPG